jgi:replicative DNA helicase
MLPLPLHQTVNETRMRLLRARNNPGEICGYPTGLPVLDTKLGGLQPGELIILGARPGQGKTALAMQWAVNVAEYAQANDVPGQVAFACGEMPSYELMYREIARRTGVPVLRQRQGIYHSEEEWDLVLDELDLMESLPLDIYNHARIELAGIEQWISKMHGGVIMLVIDYLQLVRSADPRQSRYQIISEAINRIRELRDQMQAPILVLSQLSRPEDGKDMLRPSMTDFRDSGSIEEAANLAMLLYNPAALPGVAPEHMVTELIIAKNRQGWVGSIPLEFCPERVSFRDPNAEQGLAALLGDPDEDLADTFDSARATQELVNA